MKKTQIEKFINDQLSQWHLACDNFRALKGVKVREIQMNGLKVRIQFNPYRIISTAADVGADAVKRRKCFLCRENRPAEQIRLKFEGRKSKKYDILVNPYPIFHNHLVIASDRHVGQAIWKRYVDMLDLTKALGQYVIFYNGAHCGASAPDHFHFQAAAKRQMPIECDVDRLLDGLCATGSSVMKESGSAVSVTDSEIREVSGTKIIYLASVQDAHLYHYQGFLPGIFVLEAATSKSAAKMFYRLLDCALSMNDGIVTGETSDSDPKPGREPMFNLFSWYGNGKYRSVIIFRRAHRPHHYFESGQNRLMISPGCADMAGVVITPLEEDFGKLDARMLGEVFEDVSLSAEAEKGIIWRLTRTQPDVSVGIMSARQIEFEILSDGAGPRFASYKEGKIEYDGALYDELFFEAPTPSTVFAEPAFVLHGVTIGVDFHWERRETQKFAGALKIIVEKDSLTAVNIIGVEDYLLSVISSEMKATASIEFLKAHAVISRSWVMSRIQKRQARNETGLPDALSFLNNVPSLVSYVNSMKNGQDCNVGFTKERSQPYVEELVRWYDHKDHRAFDVCADDHCQRYQGLSRAVGVSARKAVDATWGETLTYDGQICDTRFSKCCGGITEKFSTCWEDKDYPYLQSVQDVPEEGGEAFCSHPDKDVLAEALNDYDLETEDFYRWTEEYGREEISGLISRKLGRDIGELQGLVPLERGNSGRISRLLIKGTEYSAVVGKELEIRRLLSETHLKSSAFEVEYHDADGKKVWPDDIEKSGLQDVGSCGIPSGKFVKVVLKGSGWGHGVGLCQIGAAVMASRGYTYREILKHYYRGALILREPNKL